MDVFKILEIRQSTVWCVNLYGFELLDLAKETTLERADFILQLLMFVTAAKEKRMYTFFFLSSFCQLLSPRF